METKPVDSLGIGDLQAHPVWQYVNDDELGELHVRPVKRLPVATLTGKVVGTQVRLGNGSSTWALLGNISAKNARLTEHFVTLSLFQNGCWRHLSRYHDYDAETNGPAALAEFLGLPVDEMFPITYDVQQYAKGDPAALSGQILKEPRERLSRAEIIGLAVPIL